MSVSELPLTLRDVEYAADAISGAVMRTPLRHSATLSRIAGCDIWLKFENLQFTASFKERGALNRLLSLSETERARGVIAMSAGNHAQGVACHAGRLAIPATIVMPEGTPFGKVKHTRDFGARVILSGASLTEARATAYKLAEEENLVFIHPYDDTKVMAGQGTLALEMLEKEPELDTLVVPVGGGGLISGVAVAATGVKPGIDVYGVQTGVFPSMYNVLHKSDLSCGGQTVAEGIAVKEAGSITRQIVQSRVKDILLASESEIEKAIATLLEIEKTVVEGAGAVGLAAVMNNRARFAGKKVGIVLSGGNIDMRMLANVSLRELSRQGRIMSLVIQIEDRPGILAKVTGLIGEAGGNILEVVHNRMVTDTSAKLTDLGLTVEARDASHAAEIREALNSAGFQIRS